MTTPYGSDLERKVQRLSQAVNSLDDLESQVRHLREDLDDETASIGSRLDSAEYALRERRSEIESLEERVDSTESDVEPLDGAVKDLIQRVAWLERRVRTAAGGSAVDLDTTNSEIARLVKKITAGRSAEAQLLSTADRTRYTRTVLGFDQAATALEQARSTVLAAASTLATAAHDSPAFEDATRTYRTASSKVRTAATQVERLQRDAANARSALSRDESLDQTLAEAVDAGQDAQDALSAIARSRISEALASSDLLPVWFTTVLGPMPPHSGTKRWLDQATQTLVYRLTYSVDDPILALGRIPAQATARQRADHKDAETGLR